MGDVFAGLEKMISRKPLASYFLRKDENPLPHSRSSKYDAGQEIRTGTPESSDVRLGEVLKLHATEHRTGTGYDGRSIIIQCIPPLDPKQGATWKEERPGRHT